MARFITLSFKWRQKEFTAFVTLKPMADDVQYTITFNHADLYAVIPDGTLNFYGSGTAQLLDQHMSAASIDLINVIVSELLLKHSKTEQIK